MMLCVHQKMQDLDERRVQKLAQGYILFSETEKHVMPIIGKCLEGITKAGTNVNERNVSWSKWTLQRSNALYCWMQMFADCSFFFFFPSFAGLHGSDRAEQVRFWPSWRSGVWGLQSGHQSSLIWQQPGHAEGPHGHSGKEQKQKFLAF